MNDDIARVHAVRYSRLELQKWKRWDDDSGVTGKAGLPAWHDACGHGDQRCEQDRRCPQNVAFPWRAPSEERRRREGCGQEQRGPDHLRLPSFLALSINWAMRS